MENPKLKKLRSLLFNNSREISHAHVFGEDGSGRSEIIRQQLMTPEDDWVCASGDFLYGDGSLKLLLEALATDIGFKTRGDRAEDFICRVYENVEWPNPENKKILIFLDNAQAIVNYSPPSLQCFLDSYKEISDMLVRFVTSAPSCFNEYHTYLSHLQVLEFHIPSISDDETKMMIARANPSISAQFVHIAVSSLSMFCNSPNTLLAISTEAWEMYESKGEREKFDTTSAKECIRKAAGQKLGLDAGEQKTGEAEDAFETMTLAMSNNSVQSDSRWFVKNHGRDKRSEKKELRAEENRLTKELGAKAADLQRIICIYQTLLQMNESLSGEFDVKNVIASLDSMGLVSVTNRNNLDMPKIKCHISLESALKIAGSINLELRNYLEYAT